MSIIKSMFGTGGAAPPPTFAIDPVTKAAAQRVERGGHCSCLASRTKKGSPSVPNLHAESQDTGLPGWDLLLEEIEASRASGATVLEPSAVIPVEHWPKIITLPEEIESLDSLKELRLYGSHLRRLPPELGRLSALENLDIYTSYSLHWLPYEVTRCLRLRQSRMSTRALYGNIKTRLPFPQLSTVVDALAPRTCSVCDQPFGPNGPQLFWTTQRVGTDIVPLLIHSCSSDCTARVPNAPEGYNARPHRGGGGVGMPDPEED